MSKHRNQKGQSLVESCFALILIVSTLFLLFQLLYYGWARAWIQRSTYQLLLCHVSATRTSVCNPQYRQSASRSLPWGQFTQLRVRKSEDQVAAEIQFRLNTLISIHYQDSLKLPLQIP